MCNVLSFLDLRIVIRKRVFKNPMEDIIDPVEYNLLYNQSIEDATIKDLYSVTQYECIELAALRAQGFFGDDDKETVEKTM